MGSGEDRAWEELAALEPEDVCRRSLATVDAPSGAYLLPCLGHELIISPSSKTIECESRDGDILLNRYRYFSQLSALRYLVDAQDMLPADKLVAPAEMAAAQLYFKGSHILPLDRLAARYDQDCEAFLARGNELGGEAEAYGDAALRLLPLPRIPVVIILWSGDEEFPARASLLFDASCEIHLQPDIVWSVAMLSVLMLF